MESDYWPPEDTLWVRSKSFLTHVDSWLGDTAFSSCLLFAVASPFPDRNFLRLSNYWHLSPASVSAGVGTQDNAELFPLAAL